MSKIFGNKDINNFYMNYSKLRASIENANVSISTLCLKIGIDRQTFYNNIDKRNMRVDTLEKICEFLELNICDFFEMPKTAILKTTDELDYKTKYFEALEKLNKANERLLAYTDLAQNLIEKTPSKKPKSIKI